MKVETTIEGSSLRGAQPRHRPGFSSFKTDRPILYPARWHRDLLIQATLDPEIDAIEQARFPTAGPDALSLHLSIGHRRILVVGVRDGDEQGFDGDEEAGIRLARSTVLAEPRAADARAVWATRGMLVQPGDRLRILIAAEDGGTHGIRELAACVRDLEVDPFEAVLSLVCRGDLVIDMKDGLHPEARVRRRIRAQQTSAMPLARDDEARHRA